MSIWTWPSYFFSLMSVLSVSVSKCFLSELFPSVFTFLNVCLADPTDVWTEPKCFSCQSLFSKSNWCLHAFVYRILTSICLNKFPMSFAKSVWGNLMSFRINPLPFLPVSFCQYLLWVICWCLFGLNSRVFLPVSFGEFNRCLPEVFPNVFCQICLKGSLDVFPDQPNIFLASVCLMGLISVCPSWFSPVSLCQCLLWGTCWCLSGLNSRAFLPVSF